jgi:hypothetical protein
MCRDDEPGCTDDGGAARRGYVKYRESLGRKLPDAPVIDAEHE